MNHRNFTRSSSARSYSGRRLRNPFFSHEPRRIPPLFALAAIVFVSLGIIACIVYAPFFRYRDVRVEGLTTLTQDAVASTAWQVLDKRRLLVVPGKNILFANRDRIERDLLQTYNFASLALRREGRTFVVTAEERITQIAWLSGDKTYLVDLTGIAVSEASAEAKAAIDARRNGAQDVPFAPGLQPTMPVIIDESAQEVTLGQSVLAGVTLERILQLDKALRERTLVPEAYTLETPTAPWITVGTAATALLIDITKDMGETLATFDAFRHERNEPLEQLLYIDLRFGNHVYIKSR